MAKKKDSRLKRARVKGYNKPRRTPSHPKKSHIVVAKVGTKIMGACHLLRCCTTTVLGARLAQIIFTFPKKST